MENALNIMYSPDKGENLLGTQQKKDHYWTKPIEFQTSHREDPTAETGGIGGIHPLLHLYLQTQD